MFGDVWQSEEVGPPLRNMSAAVKGIVQAFFAEVLLYEVTQSVDGGQYANCLEKAGVPA